MRSTALVMIVASLLLSACGGSGVTATGEAAKPVAQIIQDAQRAVRSAKSVHYTGSDARGNGCDITRGLNGTAGHCVMSSGVGIVFVRVGNGIDVRGPADLWNTLLSDLHVPHTAVEIRLMAGTWVKFPPADAPFFASLGRPTPSQILVKILKLAGPLTNDGDTTFHGQKVIALNNGQGDEFYLRASGPDYPVALINPENSVTFDHWNAPLKVSTPKHAIDLAQLGG